MQEEVDQKVISLCVTGMRMSKDVLKIAMRKWLSAKEQKKQEKRQIKVAGKSEKRRIRERNKIKQKEMPRGKQNLRKLMDQKMELKNIPITKDNIKSFDRIARKYGVDYSLKKDVASKGTPKYLVFFKAKDVDVITAAFQEYAGVTLKKKEKRASVHNKLENAKMVVKNRARKEKQRIRQKIKHREQKVLRTAPKIARKIQVSRKRIPQRQMVPALHIF